MEITVDNFAMFSNIETRYFFECGKCKVKSRKTQSKTDALKWANLEGFVFDGKSILCRHCKESNGE